MSQNMKAMMADQGVYEESPLPPSLSLAVIDYSAPDFSAPPSSPLQLVGTQPTRVMKGMMAVRSVYEESGMKGLVELQRSLKDYMYHVETQDKLPTQIGKEILPARKVLDKLAKQTKKHTKDLHKSLRSHFALKRKAERELAKSAAVEEKRVAKEAALAKKNMGVAFRYFKRIQRDAKRVKAAEAKRLEKAVKEAKKVKAAEIAAYEKLLSMVEPKVTSGSARKYEVWEWD